jgi:penicillin-binding protein 1A
MLQQRVGTRPVLRLANDLGVTEQPDVPSLALGSGLVSPLDLTAAFAVFPNLGYRVRPRGLVSVENANGSTVHRVHIERDKILSEPVAFQMVSMLQDVVLRGTGAGVRAQGVRGAVGGKTGTTSEKHDAWFVGSIHRWSSAFKVDQPQKIFGCIRLACGAAIWADFMRRTARRLRRTSPPDDMRREQICMLSYRRALGDARPGISKRATMSPRSCARFTRSLQRRPGVDSGTRGVRPGHSRIFR